MKINRWFKAFKIIYQRAVIHNLAGAFNIFYEALNAFLYLNFGGMVGYQFALWKTTTRFSLFSKPAAYCNDLIISRDDCG
jgi:hypothetical protein